MKRRGKWSWSEPDTIHIVFRSLEHYIGAHD